MGEGTFMYFQPIYLQELGASPLVIGSILGGVGLAMTLFHIPAGFLSDRLGRRQLMWTAWGMGVITTGIMAAAKSLAVFSIGIILYSTTLFVVAPLNSYITAARGKLSVEQVLTTNNAGFFLGGIAGPLIGGALAEGLGLRSIYFFAFGCFIISSMRITKCFVLFQKWKFNSGSLFQDPYRSNVEIFILVNKSTGKGPEIC